jgi:glycosyltransferase involved in cell wall biosynthesis
MNVLQVAPYFPPYQGGQEAHVQNLTTSLRDRGHTVKVLTSDYPPDETGDRCKVYRLPVVKRMLRNPIVSPNAKALELFRWADVAHTHNEHAFVSNLSAVLGKHTGTPTVLTCHGQLSFGSRVSDAIERLYNRTVGAGTLKAMDRVVALSESDRAYLAGLGVNRTNIEIIPNAIEVPKPVSKSAGEEFKTEYNIDGQRVVLFLGPVVRRKSPETLLRAIPQIREEHPDIVGVFVGSGEYKPEITTRARRLGLEETVQFTGYLPENELKAAYKAASVLAVPSVSEGLPTTILEGMAHEVPVVATNLDPIRDWFDDYAVLVDSEPDAFSDAIRNILSQTDRAARLGAEGSDFVESQFTWERVSKQVDRVYRDIAVGQKSVEGAETTLA